MPTDMRTNPSVMPRRFRSCECGTEACVIVAGCEIRVSTPPRLSPSEQSDAFQKPLRVIETVQIESDHSTKTAHLLFRQLVAWMIRQAGKIDLLHLRFSGQVICDGLAICVVRVHSYGQRFDAAKNEPGIERRKNRPCGVLNELKPIGIVLTLEHDHAAHAVAVTVEIFRCRCGRRCRAPSSIGR